MKKWIVPFLGFVIVFTMFFGTAHAKDAVPKKVMQAKDSVVRIVTEYTSTISSGTGFVIYSDNEKTLIATNYHVVDGNALTISVFLENDEKISAYIIAYSSQKDLCILELAYPISFQALILRENGVAQGDPVYAVGFPGAADNFSESIAKSSKEATITDGIVSAIRQVPTTSYGSPVKILQINADINPGNSGGPLFNNLGEVVGVNTYGILDSQGINGAIEIGELITFLSDSNLSPIVTPAKTPSTLLMLILILLAATLIFVIIIFAKKNRLSNVIKVVFGKQNRGKSLRDYMENHPNGLGINEAIALLMPVAVQIQKTHEDGKLHLQVSPDKIIIKNNIANLIEPSNIESDMYYSGFASPEVYRHKGISAPSDIYSFCAILSFVASGTIPDNALDFEENKTVSFQKPFVKEDFISIVSKGLAQNAADRFQLMQDLVNMLLPFTVKYNKTTAMVQGNILGFLGNNETAQKECDESIDIVTHTISNTKLRSSANKKRITIIALSCVICAVMAISGIYFIAYKAAHNNATEGDFETAKKLLLIPSVTKLHDQDLIAYVNAGLLLNNRQFVTAERLFASLSGYLNADQLLKESKYRHAAMLADANNFEEAINIYSDLSISNYKDSGILLLETRFRRGVYFLYELSDYKVAEVIFSALNKSGYEKAEEMYLETYYLWGISLADEENYLLAYDKLQECSDYENTRELLNSLKLTLYEIGAEFYEQGSYNQSRQYFEKLGKYSRSQDYLTLIGLHKSLSHTQADIQKLISLIGFEDAGSLIFKNNGHYFFNGKFSCSSGYINLYKDANGNWKGQWNIPGIPSESWYFRDGTFYTNYKARFDIYATSANTVVIYVIGSSKTYTLTRG